MIFKIFFTLLVLGICIIIYQITKDKEHSLGFTVATGLITVIIGNFFIPSDISLFDIFEHAKEASNNTEELNNTEESNNAEESNDTDNVSYSIKLDSNSLDLISTDEYDLKATVSPDDCDIKWSSDNKDIVTVDDNGHLEAIKEGNAIITATITYKDNNYTDTCLVKVTAPVIALDPSCSLYVDETYDLSVETIPENTVIVWSSSNPEVVDVNNNGKIEGISEGTAIVTASMVYGNISYSADCAVTVEALIEANDEVESDTVALTDDTVVWIDEENVHTETSQKTVREDWDDCIRFGSSNLNADSDAYIIVACDQKYSKFTAEIAPQKGFDKSEKVVLYVYGVRDGKQISKEEYYIDITTKNTEIELEIIGADELYIYKDGDYSQAKIAGQYINGYTGMGVLMRNAVLHK